MQLKGRLQRNVELGAHYSVGVGVLANTPTHF